MLVLNPRNCSARVEACLALTAHDLAETGTKTIFKNSVRADMQHPLKGWDFIGAPGRLPKPHFSGRAKASSVIKRNCAGRHIDSFGQTSGIQTPASMMFVYRKHVARTETLRPIIRINLVPQSYI